MLGKYFNRLGMIVGWTRAYQQTITRTWPQLVFELREELWLAHVGLNGVESGVRMEALVRLSNELYTEYPELFI